MAYYKMALLFPLNLHHLYLITSTSGPLCRYLMNLVIHPIFCSQVLGLGAAAASR